jgi:nucleoside-diphosphate-sugar epimerase
MSVLVTGAAGFLGAHLVRHLAGAWPGERILAADRDAPPDTVRTAWAAPNIEALRLDVTEPDAVRALLHDAAPRLVIHAAAVTPDAQTERNDPARILAVNATATATLWHEALATRRFERGILISSGAVYGNAAGLPDPLLEDTPPAPEALYGIAKLAAEGIARRLGALAGQRLLVVRLPSLYGAFERPTAHRPRASEIHALLAALRAGETVASTPSEVRRDWTDAEDAAAAIRHLAELPAPRHDTYNVSTGLAVTWRETLALFAAHGLRLGAQGAPIAAPSRDRPPLDPSRLEAETGFRPRRSLADHLTRLMVAA